MKRTPGGHFSVGAMPRSYQVTPGRPWRQRATACAKVSNRDQGRLSQPEAVKDNPPRARSTQRQLRLSLKRRSEHPAMAHARARAKAGVFMVGFGGERTPRDVASRPLAASACSWKQQRMDGGAK